MSPARLLGFWSIGLAWTASLLAAGESAEFFENHIRPLLAEHCHECHATETKQKGGLVLDSRAGWASGGDNGPAIFPGQPERSLLIKAVEYIDPDLQMPPKKKLRPAEIAALKQWIAQGAHDPREAPAKKAATETRQNAAAHWAWQPLPAAKPPAPQARAWPLLGLDAFLLADLEGHDLPPAPPASRRTWARRVGFDLTGLPLAPAVLAEFLADTSPTAEERLVDRLLANPHYGETWGQHWLDLVRFAETLGHEQDFPIPHAWRYRDYVIRAFNADVPYDTLITEQVAGDLMEQPRLDPASKINESIHGTGFWHFGEATHSPVDIRGDECTRVANQIDVFSKAFLGLTVQCARCHDHKFDPIPTRDYYALFGFLQSSSYQLADVTDPIGQRHTRAEILAAKARHQPAMLARAAEQLLAWQPALSAKEISACAGDPADTFFPLALAAKHADFAQAKAEISQRWASLAADSQARLAAQRVLRTDLQGERNYLPSERPFTAKDVVMEAARLSSGEWITSGLMFGRGPAKVGDVIADERLEMVAEAAARNDLASTKLSGFLRTRTFEVTADKLWFRYRGQANVFIDVDSHRVCQGPLHSNNLRQKLPPTDDFRWAAHNVQRYLGHRIHVEFAPEGPFALSQVIFCKEEPATLFAPNPLLAKIVADESLRNADDLTAAYQALAASLAEKLAQGVRLDQHEATLANAFLPLGPCAGISPEQRGEIAELEKRIPEPLHIVALLDGNAENEFVHIRGNHRSLGQEAVPRAFLAVLGGGPIPATEQGSGRLSLAKAMIGQSSGLISRVMANRVWHKLMGRGLVETVDNFGHTGANPSHPALLDHLASEFIASDWSFKNLLRRIVLSRTYRMSSAETNERDPRNLHWHRMNIRRLPAEAIRDSILAVSGRLEERLFGASIPVHIPPETRSNRSPAESGPADGAGRRSIYLENRRNHLDLFLLAFDKPSPFTTIGARNISNSPAQPLMLMNSPFVHEQAARWAARLPGDDPQGRITMAYEMAFGRAPLPEETRAAAAFLAEQIGQGRSQQEAWTDLAHTFYNVKEFLFLP